MTPLDPRHERNKRNGVRRLGRLRRRRGNSQDGCRHYLSPMGGAKYRDCLATAATPHACEREKLIMEADERALTNTAAAVDGGSAL